MLSKIVLGTVQFGLNYGINNKNGQIQQNEALKILQYCKDIGIRYLDTASAYGNAEVVIGGMTSSSFKEEDFEITTKLKFAENEDLYSSINQSLQRLRRSKIECVLFHSLKDYQKYLHFSRPKIVNKWGVSVYTNKEILQVIDDENIKVIQCPFNLLDNELNKGKILREAKSRGIEVQARSVFLQGLFFKNITELSKSLLVFKPYLRELSDICSIHNVTMYELALGYCLSKEYIDKLVIGVDSLCQLHTNVTSINYNIPKGVYDRIDNILFENVDLLNPSNWSIN